MSFAFRGVSVDYNNINIDPIYIPTPTPAVVDPDATGSVVSGSASANAESLQYALSGLVSIAWAQEPWRVLWSVRSDGVLLGTTYRRDQGVLAWHRHPMTNGAVEDVAVIPNPETGRSQVWMAVQRVIDGQTVRYIEYITERHEPDSQSDLAGYNFMDCSLTYEGTAATEISNLDHLEGETVQVWTNAGRHTDKTVVSGSITLDAAATTAHVGIHTPSFIRTLPAEAGSANGTAQGKKKTIGRVRLRVVESMGGKIGGDLDETLDDLLIRQSSDPQNASPPLRSGIVDGIMASKFDREGQFVILQDFPAPFTITALVPEVDGTDY